MGSSNPPLEGYDLNKDKGNNMTRKTINDNLGEYEVNTKNALDIDGAKSVYVSLFDNGDRKNAARYKVTLALVNEENGETIYEDYVCPIINHYEPERFFRMVPDEIKDNPFYRQMQSAINEIKKDAHNQQLKFNKSPSMGMFRIKRSKSQSKTGEPVSILNAIAMLHIQEDCDPYVVIRFSDFTWSGELQPTGSEHTSSPTHSICVKTSDTPNRKKAVVSDYF